MPEFYQGNGIYQYLWERELFGRYFWASGNMWTLLYANLDGEPVTLCFASRVDREEELLRPATEEEAQVYRPFRRLAEQAQMPLFTLRFVEDGLPCRQFHVKLHGDKLSRLVSSEELLDWLRQTGLRFQGGAAHKQVNDRPSSSFHLWQRIHMGTSIVAADLDLMRMEGERFDTLYELKRSFQSLEAWTPYGADRVNYLAQLQLARRAGAKFQTVYNVRHTKPSFFDDVSRLKIYDMDQGWPGTCLGETAIEDYFT